uniref:Uncharacterized protein n=1 Tax=Lepeophtheirus salmonis TaxID=72036 RepID=A0A0K2TVP3_LEPSM
MIWYLRGIMYYCFFSMPKSIINIILYTKVLFICLIFTFRFVTQIVIYIHFF